MRLALIAVPLLTSLLCLPTAADQITLTNGDRLTGSVRELDGENLRMKTELAGTVTVPWSAIASLATEEPLAVTLPDERVIVGTLATRDDTLEIQPEAEPLTVRRDEVRALRTPEAQRAYEERLHPGLLDLWQGNVDAGLASTRGNSDTTTLTLGLGATRKTGSDKLSTYFNSLFTRDSTSGDAEVIANTLRTGLRYERNFRQRHFTFGFSDFEFDELQDLDLRWVLGGGLGWRLRQTDRTQLELFAGGSLNQEHFTGQPVRRSGEVLVGEELNWQLTARTTLKERLTFYPNLSDTGEYRVTFDSTLDYKLNSWLSWQTTLSDRFLSNPPPDTQKNALLLTTGLRLSFGGTAQ
jgi:putative salt-induced outer membrane protein YdiY